MEDRELLREYVEHQSEKAFGELVSRHVNLVYGAAMRVVGESQMAQDIAQVVFIRLAREGRFIRDGSRLSGWLYRATCNAAANAVRTEQRRREREGKAVNEARLNSGAEAKWEGIAPLLEEAMGELKQTDQDAIVLRYFEGKSLQEVGQRLAVSDDAAQKRISRALEKLRTHFAGRGLKCSSALLVTLLASASSQAAPIGLATGLAASSLASAASMGGSTIATFLETIFMTKTKTAIVASVMVAAVVTPIVVQQNENGRLKKEVAALRQNIAITQGATNDALGSTRQATANEVAAAINWRALESTDYRKYIANLRAAGCPEQTIRDIIITDLDRTYGQRIAKLSAPSAGSRYWMRQYSTVNTRRELEIKQIEEEKRAAIRELLGTDADEEAHRRTGVPAPYDQGFEFLAADKRARLREIDRQFKAQLSANDAHRAGWREQDWHLQHRDAWVQKDEAIKQLLSPAEFEEYEMRSGHHAAGLRVSLSAFEPSEQEFRKILQIEKDFGKDKSYIDPRQLGFPEPSVPDPATEQQFQKALREALGEQRYAEYELSRDNNYAFLQEIVHAYELPKENARAVFDLNKAAEQRASAIRANPSLTADARAAAFQALRNQIEEQVTSLLGDEGFRAYQWQFSGLFNNKLSK